MAIDSNRRQFLRGVGGGVLGLSTLSAATPIIDTHIHLYDPTRPQGVPWPPKTDSMLYKPILPAAYSAMVGPLGITGAIVIEASPWLEDNQWVLDLARQNPIIAGLVGHLEPGTDAFRRDLARFARNPLFRGIRLNGGVIADSARPAFFEDLERLADAGLMLDAIGDAAMIPPLLTLTDKIPKLRIAVDHMPGEPTGWQASDDTRRAMRELARRPQVFCKVSGVRPRVDGRQALDELWEMFGADRVMYGSNWPVSDRVAQYPEILRAVKEYVEAKGTGASAAFFAGNSKACYRWTDSAKL